MENQLAQAFDLGRKFQKAYDRIADANAADSGTVDSARRIAAAYYAGASACEQIDRFQKNELNGDQALLKEAALWVADANLKASDWDEETIARM